MLKIAITGSTGLVGSRIQELLYHDFIFVPLLQPHVDITDKKSVDTFVGENDFDIMLHLAAYTQVDQAEREKDLARKINIDGTKYLSDAVLKKKKKFIYISTDFVFDGENPPYDEESKPNPIGWYAKTKYKGEQIVGKNGMIVRISYPYRASFDKKKDLVQTLRSKLEQEEKISMLTDTLITPTFIDDIAFALKYLFVNFSNEIFHIVGSDSLSPYELALQITRVFNLKQGLIGKTTYNILYKKSPIRPRRLVAKSKKNHFWKMKSVEEGLLTIKNQK